MELDDNINILFFIYLIFFCFFWWWWYGGGGVAKVIIYVCVFSLCWRESERMLIW